MANFGAQLSLELAKIKPIRDLAGTAYDSLLRYAREVRKSGSDIVVEEDLATIFGRMRISEALEIEFKNAVKETKSELITPTSEVTLDANAGPTVLRGFREQSQMAMVIQLSLLANFHDIYRLATTISDAIRKRSDNDVEGAVADPGADGIASSIDAISSQSNSFAWSHYSQKVERRLRMSIPTYQYNLVHSRLSRSLILGAIDFLYIVQSLPNDRRIVISSEEGCIPMIVWAHYVLDLDVLINVPGSEKVLFGRTQDPQIVINWIGRPSEQHEMLLGPVNTAIDATISLSENDMEALIVHEPDIYNGVPLRTDDRHSAQGFCTVYMRRVFNTNSLVLDDDPIYTSAAALSVALAIHVSQKLVYTISPESEANFPKSPKERVQPEQPIGIEHWRILQAGDILFHGVSILKSDVLAFVEYLQDNGMDESSLPKSFGSYLKNVKLGKDKRRPKTRILNHIRRLVQLVLLFSFISEIDQCGSMPIRFSSEPRYRLHEWTNKDAFGPLSTKKVHITLRDIFDSILDLLGVEHSVYGNFHMPNFTFLCSEYGWSVWYDFVGDKDPSEVTLGLVHVAQGVPTRTKTGERKKLIKDAYVANRYQPWRGLRETVRSGAGFVPRATGTVKTVQEFWAVKPDCFEFYRYYTFIADELPALNRYTDGLVRFSLGPGYLGYTLMSNVAITPQCEHEPLPSKSVTQSQTIKLGPDAVTINAFASEQKEGPRITVFLTRGVPALRWQAIVGIDGNRMLVSHDCCEPCALVYTASQNGRWSLIL